MVHEGARFAPYGYTLRDAKTGEILWGKPGDTDNKDPGPDVGEGPPTVRVRIDSQTIPLWPVRSAGRAACSRSQETDALIAPSPPGCG